MSINSLMKKNYNIFYSLCSFQSVEAHPGLKPLEVDAGASQEITSGGQLDMQQRAF
jgi:hypothetical protein